MALHELVKACIAAHLIAPTLHQVLNEQAPRLNQSSAEAKITLLLREFLVQRHDQIQIQYLELSVFILEQTIESLVHAAMIDLPEFLQESQLEEEMTRLLLSFLADKPRHACNTELQIQGNILLPIALTDNLKLPNGSNKRRQ